MTTATPQDRDAVFMEAIGRTFQYYAVLDPNSSFTVADDIEANVDKNADKDVFRFEGASTTYRQFDERANRFANWGLAQGLKRGDTIILFATNRPDYVACWFGMTKIGVTTALVNSNLIGSPLAHSFTISNARIAILSGDMAEGYRSAVPLLKAPLDAWALDGAAGFKDLDAALAAASSARPPTSAREGLTQRDLALLVYTSGTTGAPKAARMTHSRVLGMMRAFIGGAKGVPEDRVYVTLPLYHATGGLTGIGFALTLGATIILRRKFSASHFWEEATTENASVFFYIGELCRYLLNAPPHPQERAHHLRVGVGNGLRPEVWEKFQERFNIPQMLEFYGSTEGNVSMINFDGKVGAVGRIPEALRAMLNVKLVKFDVEADAPVRGPDGFCVEAATDEPGEALGEIKQDDARGGFEGYSDKAQTEKKILRNVFREGDAWFRTGDLLRVDADGYFYFVDRIGDTFRWKGENVSTNEVADVISSAPGVEEAVVYGVRIGDLDGRAGMVSVTPGDGFDLAKLRTAVHANLATYARPMFVRIQPAIETTGTFKYRKVDLVNEGFDPTKTTDALYVDDAATGAYQPISADLFAKIQSGNVRL